MNIYTADLETDPFERDLKPEPFCAGMYNGEVFRSFWGVDCVDQMCDALYNLPPGIVYFHNGGKFDFFYMLHRLELEKGLLIIKDRITQAHMKCVGGYHKIRDSLKILPFALKQYQKDEIDYNKLRKENRGENRDEIIKYLRGDCVYLHELCSGFVDMFGPTITVGSAAIKELKKLHDVGEPLTADIDYNLRKSYYLGGRVERYKTGVFNGAWKVYDVNSMYPYVMANYFHPIGYPTTSTKHITPDTYFVTARGKNRGAFPMRDKKSGIRFDVADGVFSVTIHEWKAAQELGLFDCDEVIECVNFGASRMFYDYVMHFYNLRKKAILDGDKLKTIFYKYVLNTSYGKFAVNPENFKDYQLSDDETDLRWYDPNWCVSEIMPQFKLILWEKQSSEAKYANVATGASITGAARSVLMRGLHNAVNPMYCDTDCIICEEMNLIEISDANLGAWKLEKTGNSLAIAGRKMYALFDENKCVKYACKGVRISPEQIVRVASGEVVTYKRESPTYHLNGDVDWLTRRIRMV